MGESVYIFACLLVITAYTVIREWQSERKIESIKSIYKDCLDRIMAKSLQEYKLPVQPNEDPQEPKVIDEEDKEYEEYVKKEDAWANKMAEATCCELPKEEEEPVDGETPEATTAA